MNLVIPTISSLKREMTEAELKLEIAIILYKRKSVSGSRSSVVPSRCFRIYALLAALICKDVVAVDPEQLFHWNLMLPIPTRLPGCPTLQRNKGRW